MGTTTTTVTTNLDLAVMMLILFLSFRWFVFQILVPDAREFLVHRNNVARKVVVDVVVLDLDPCRVVPVVADTDIVVGGDCYHYFVTILVVVDVVQNYD